MDNIKKATSINELITHLELALSSEFKAEDLSPIAEILAGITERGILKPSNTRGYEKAITLLDQLEKKTTNADLAGDIIEVKHRLYVSKNLINYKENAKYSTRELATKANLSHSYISRIESCQLRVPSSEAIKNLAMALVIEPKFLDPNYKGDNPEFLLPAYKNPTAREILDELDGVNDQTLEFFLRFVKDMKNLSKNDVRSNKKTTP
ncbi:hypothetical protein DP73_21180 [Desulfosporosinus sp. HMP52]|uniref:helix-turn-helix domain-containing protein n=1 Tax=Desulfosporosinus sp. HMP52 TaxID=1487923 RepID=UPI00051FC5E9|nr:helix-turn-helix transcriptional regulator [Desulfosporosinus sp. HMP52]KGK81784.1 hypothetical protein DP73_21180 [Desulfosporosinus sp. HMP52]